MKFVLLLNLSSRKLSFAKNEDWQVFYKMLMNIAQSSGHFKLIVMSLIVALVVLQFYVGD